MNTEQIGLGIASLPVRSVWDAVKTVRRMGLRSIELMPFWGENWVHGYLPGFWFDDFSSLEKARFRKELADFSHVSTHAPFVNTPLFTFNRGIKQEVMRQIKNCIKVTEILGGEMITVHANAKSPFLGVKGYWRDMVDAFRELGDFGAKKGVKIGIETMFPKKVRQYVDLIFDVGHPFVGATIDVGHISYYIHERLHRTPAGEEKFNRYLGQMLAELDRKVFHLHLHNVRRKDWRDHLSVTSGIIDYVKLFQALKRIEYDRLMILEFGGSSEQVIRWTHESKSRIETLMLED
ncbi:MAG: sugar phosphate isomerase/epimerase [Verrucomicrobiae bacterium]|nr:sugar phosphate isomerase/epimerase [Verrucomicrobiae bacterium]